MKLLMFHASIPSAQLLCRLLCAALWGAVICNPALADTKQTSIGGADKAGFDQHKGLPGVHELLSSQPLSIFTDRTTHRYSLLIRTSSNRSIREDMFDTPWDVATARLAANGRAIVDLPLTGGIDEIYIVNPGASVMLDHFGCRNPSLSPDGKLLTFLAWYPAHASSDDLTSDFVMLYDLRKDAIENRHKPRVDFPLMNDTDRQVGAQLYPLSRPLDHYS